MNRNKLSLLLAIITILSTGLPASAQLTSGDINLINIGVGLFNSIINPPHRAAEINAEVELKKAKMAADVDIEREKLRIEATADKVGPVLNKWGVARVGCTPGVVFINGLDPNANTVCVQPNQVITPGYYTYNNQHGVLSRNISTVPRTTPTPPNNSVMTRLNTPGNTSGKGF
jgi:hypothetical protein